MISSPWPPPKGGTDAHFPLWRGLGGGVIGSPTSVSKLLFNHRKSSWGNKPYHRALTGIYNFHFLAFAGL